MSLSTVIPVSEARDRLTELLTEAITDDIVLLKHGKPVGVLMGVDRYESMTEKAEELDDILAAQEPDEYEPYTRTTASQG